MHFEHFFTPKKRLRSSTCDCAVKRSANLCQCQMRCGKNAADDDQRLSAKRRRDSLRCKHERRKLMTNSHLRRQRDSTQLLYPVYAIEQT